MKNLTNAQAISILKALRTPQTNWLVRQKEVATLELLAELKALDPEASFDPEAVDLLMAIVEVSSK